jgi:hypothetical protein
MTFDVKISFHLQTGFPLGVFLQTIDQDLARVDLLVIDRFIFQAECFFQLSVLLPKIAKRFNLFWVYLALFLQPLVFMSYLLSYDIIQFLF